MPNIIPEPIEAFAAAHTIPESKLLQALARETHAKAQAPQMQVGHVEGAFLRLLARLTRAKRVLEIGTFTGYSALAMAEALPGNGKLITLDIDPVATKMARKYWARSPHGRKIQLKLGPAIESLSKLKGPFDMAFIDADKANYIRYWEAVLPLVRRGGLIAIDNVLWNGRVLDPKDESDRVMAKFDRHAASDSRVETVLATVRDGILMAYVR